VQLEAVKSLGIVESENTKTDKRRTALKLTVRCLLYIFAYQKDCDHASCYGIIINHMNQNSAPESSALFWGCLLPFSYYPVNIHDSIFVIIYSCFIFWSIKRRSRFLLLLSELPSEKHPNGAFRSRDLIFFRDSGVIQRKVSFKVLSNGSVKAIF
jgi:hypothetical protein